MKTINLPSGNAFGVDDNDGLTPYGEGNRTSAQTLFLVRVTLAAHKWVTIGERRGDTANQRPFAAVVIALVRASKTAEQRS
jgi:hypothetical protein